MKFLFLEPFFGGSHKDFAEGLVAHSRHAIELVTLPARFWKWRMRGAALHFYNRKRPVNPIFTTSQVGGILHTKNMEERLCKDKTGKSMNFGEHILKIGSKVALARLTIAAGTTSGTTS